MHYAWNNHPEFLVHHHLSVLYWSYAIYTPALLCAHAPLAGADPEGGGGGGGGG